MGKLKLSTVVFQPTQPDYAAGEILRKTRQNQELLNSRQMHGLVTSGFISVTQGTGGGGWGITDYIPMSYKYLGSPPKGGFFNEGTYTGVVGDETPYALTGDNTYGPDLPAALQAFVDAEDTTTFSPAIFIPRIIHWHVENSLYWVGCYILLWQANPDCTEVNKKMRIHFNFIGSGI